MTWLSFMLDVTLLGPGPRGPHLVNLGLHSINSVLVFALLCRSTGARWRSAVVAGLFAIAESVSGWCVARACGIRTRF